jgi:hypothetical protein
MRPPAAAAAATSAADGGLLAISDFGLQLERLMDGAVSVMAPQEATETGEAVAVADAQEPTSHQRERNVVTIAFLPMNSPYGQDTDVVPGRVLSDVHGILTSFGRAHLQRDQNNSMHFIGESHRTVLRQPAGALSSSNSNSEGSLPNGLASQLLNETGGLMRDVLAALPHLDPSQLQHCFAGRDAGGSNARHLRGFIIDFNNHREVDDAVVVPVTVLSTFGAPTQLLHPLNNAMVWIARGPLRRKQAPQPTSDPAEHQPNCMRLQVTLDMQLYREYRSIANIYRRSHDKERIAMATKVHHAILVFRGCCRGTKRWHLQTAFSSDAPTQLLTKDTKTTLAEARLCAHTVGSGSTSRRRELARGRLNDAQQFPLLVPPKKPEAEPDAEPEPQHGRGRGRGRRHGRGQRGDPAAASPSSGGPGGVGGVARTPLLVPGLAPGVADNCALLAAWIASEGKLWSGSPPSSSVSDGDISLPRPLAHVAPPSPRLAIDNGDVLNLPQLASAEDQPAAEPFLLPVVRRSRSQSEPSGAPPAKRSMPR